MTGCDVVHNAPRATTVTDVAERFAPGFWWFVVAESVYENEFTTVNDDAEILAVVTIWMFDLHADNSAFCAQAGDA